jgi:site-specific DNA recombinase
MATLVQVALRAVIYIRISKEEEAMGTGVASTEIQIRDARATIEANGWILVAEPFIDRGISGAEFTKRTKLHELLRLGKKGAFDVVVVRDQKRVGRDTARVVHTLVELDNCGARVFYYQQKKFADLTGTGLILEAADGHAGESERKGNNLNIRRRLREGAAAGYATGSRRFGFGPVPVEGGRPNRNGRLPQRWVINPEQVAILIRVGETFVEAKTYRRTAIALSDAHVPSPTGGPWGHKMVQRILRNPLYRGTHVHGATRTLEQRGTRRTVLAPADEVLRIPHPELSIWPPELLKKIDALLVGVRPRGLPASATKSGDRPWHLASGLLRCAVCGGGLIVVGSNRGGRSYTCNRALQQGKHACQGIGYRAKAHVEEAVRRIAASLITGKVAERAVAKVRERLTTLTSTSGRADERARIERAIAESERKQKNLARALATTDDDQTDLLEERLAERTRVDALRTELAALQAGPVAIDARARLKAIEAKLADLAHSPDPRAVLSVARRRRCLVDSSR